MVKRNYTKGSNRQQQGYGEWRSPTGVKLDAQTEEFLKKRAEILQRRKQRKQEQNQARAESADKPPQPKTPQQVKQAKRHLTPAQRNAKKEAALDLKASKLLASQREFERNLAKEEQIAIARRKKLEYIYGKNALNTM